MFSSPLKWTSVLFSKRLSCGFWLCKGFSLALVSRLEASHWIRSCEKTYRLQKKDKEKKAPLEHFDTSEVEKKAVNNQSFLSLMSASLSYWLFLHVQVCNFTRHLFLKRLLAAGPERIQSSQVFCRSIEATDNEVKSHPFTVAYSLRRTHVSQFSLQSSTTAFLTGF